MGPMRLLKFALISIDFLGWPVFALGYPLFASIRAVETGSKYHTRKLVMYWTLFSMISLLEFAFAKIIEWIPFWSSIRLVVVIGLVIPRFDGACHAYENLVCPVLSVNLQAVVHKLCERVEEKPCRRETALDVAEQFEKLISIKLRGPDATLLDNETLEATNKSATVEVEKVQYAQPKLVLGFHNEHKETEPPEKCEENGHPWTPPIQKVPQEWNCDMCKVKTTSEVTLVAHLRGNKHKSNLESLKRSMHHADKVGSSLAKGKSKQGKTDAAMINAQLQAQRGLEKRKKLKKGGANTIYKHYCCVCDAKMVSDIQLIAHLEGKRHCSRVDQLANPEHMDGALNSSFVPGI